MPVLSTDFLTKYPHKTLVLIGTIVLVLSLLTIWYIYRNNSEQNVLNKSLTEKEALVASLNTQVKNLIRENKIIATDEAHTRLKQVNDTLDKYETVKAKIASYKASGVNVGNTETELAQVIDLILSKKYTDASTLLSTIDTELETALKAKQAADAAAKAKSSGSSNTCNSVPSSGYCRLTVNASSGSFTTDIIAANLGSITVVTDTANSDNCANNCPTKSLQSYVSANGGYAGINGTYFCPADYSSCSGKVASFDFPVYNTGLKKWINEDKLFWSDRAMMAFTSGNAVFYPNSNSYSGLSGLKAGIVNFPGLVHNGANITGNYGLTSAQNTKGTRGGIGTKGNTLYLVITRSASVADLANVMIAIGATEALNLDGGGSSALYYNGAYKVGPGRSLPNALILK